MARIFVYVVRSALAVKVGQTNNPIRRIWSLGDASFSDEKYAFLKDYDRNLNIKELWFLAPFADRKTAMKVERYAHWLLRRANIVGEWFHIDPETACNAVVTAARGVEHGRSKPTSVRISSALDWRTPKRNNAIERSAKVEEWIQRCAAS